MSQKLVIFRNYETQVR